MSGVDPDDGSMWNADAKPAAETRANGEDIERELAFVYQAEAPRLYRYALALTRHHEAAQDAVQEIFLRYYVACSEGQHFQNPRAWLFRVLRNHVYDGLRTIRTNQEVGIDGLRQSPDLAHDPEEDYRRHEMVRRLSKALTARELDCVRLRAEGLDYQEIAEVLSVRPGTVGAMLARAHKKIRRSLRHAGYAVADQTDTLGPFTPKENICAP
jgi:RNA polymerase sigma-70 factor (ECF subfamily)